jgi:hypothetical protein
MQQLEIERLLIGLGVIRAEGKALLNIAARAAKRARSDTSARSVGRGSIRIVTSRLKGGVGSAGGHAPTPVVKMRLCNAGPPR